MLRFAIALLVAIVASKTAESADRTVNRHGSHGWPRTAAILPAGLPRPHYNFRTTISYGAPRVYRRPGRQLSVYENPALLYGPDYTDVRYIPRIGVALLPGSSALPGYYGSAYSYDYQSPYYGGPYAPYWDRLPYACGVYGYC